MAAAALFGFSRLPYDTTFPVDRRPGQLRQRPVPFILMMSFGMGLTFVPLTLTAVHHLNAEDSGIGSGVLNTMQQVGGALGLSLLGTIATQTFDDRTSDLGGRGTGCRRSARPARVQTRSPPGVHRGRDACVPARVDPDAGRLRRDLDVPQRQARRARHRRPGGRARRGLTLFTTSIRLRSRGGKPQAGPQTNLCRAGREKRLRPGWVAVPAWSR